MPTHFVSNPIKKSPEEQEYKELNPERTLSYRGPVEITEFISLEAGLSSF